jgi:hypothetical protein
MGGTEGGQNSATVHQQINSLIRLQELTRAAGGGVAIANHPAHTAANERTTLLRHSQLGDPNPVAYKTDRFQRFAQTLELRMGESGE